MDKKLSGEIYNLFNECGHSLFVSETLCDIVPYAMEYCERDRKQIYKALLNYLCRISSCKVMLKDSDTVYELTEPEKKLLINIANKCEKRYSEEISRADNMYREVSKIIDATYTDSKEKLGEKRRELIFDAIRTTNKQNMIPLVAYCGGILCYSLEDQKELLNIFGKFIRYRSSRSCGVDNVSFSEDWVLNE